MRASDQTKFQLKAIKHMASLSEETHCFSASLYVDGKKVGTVSNQGFGGCHDYHGIPHETLQEYARWISTNIDPHQESFTNGVTVLDYDLDWIISDLVDNHVLEKELKRLLKNRVLTHQQNNILQTQPIPAKPGTPRFELIKSKWIEEYEAEGARVLNTLPFNEALTIFKRNGQ